MDRVTAAPQFVLMFPMPIIQKPCFRMGSWRRWSSSLMLNADTIVRRDLIGQEWLGVFPSMAIGFLENGLQNTIH